ncbi:CHRNB3 [Branchiostoma lanceolatum]|uniref:CHRNB3 protein n=1 Tax=Branchiostoma lanceolatum TaxID=7740 RepID=A0A8K0A575_BRALA|nr:CHRNB3 [Branchiostoma lanceolatum]
MERRYLVITNLLVLFACACGQFRMSSGSEAPPQYPVPVQTEITLQAGNGAFNSPNFPDNYPAGLSIRWLIETVSSKVIQLTFQDFDLEISIINLDCNFDYVAVYNRDKSTNLDTLIGKFCGQTFPGSIQSYGNAMSVVFVSDGSVSRAGFNATFGTVKREGGFGYAIGQGAPNRCFAVPETFYNYCKDLGYQRTTTTNFFGQNINDTLDSPEWLNMKNLNTSCHPHLRLFICSLLMPRCQLTPAFTSRGIQFIPQQQLPCQSLCEEVKSSCPAAFVNGTLQSTDCSVLNGTDCLNLASPEDCYYGKGQNYRGEATLPEESDKLCLNWTSVLSNQLLYNYNWANPQENYCRNLGLENMQEPSCLVRSGTAGSNELVVVEPCGLKPCGAIGCGVPPDIEFGTRNPVKNFHRPGEKVFITCNAGYIRENDDMSITCTQNGTWSQTDNLGCSVDYRIQLSNTLLATDRYLPQLPPSTGHVNVSFEAAVVEIIDADEKNEHMFGSMAFRLSWKDNRLSWTPAKYGDVTQLVLTTQDVWIPNIYLYRNGDAKFSTFPDAPVTVTSDGEVGWEVVDLLTTTCDLEPALFPFDSMTCPVCLGATTSVERFTCPKEQDNEKLLASESYVKRFMKCGDERKEVVDQWNAEWTVSVVDGAFGNGCIEVKFDRIPTFHFCATLSPPIILSILMCITFLLPTDKGDRVTFGITILLSMVVSLVFITDVLPAKGSMPVVAILLVLYMCMMGVFMLITVVVIKIGSREGHLPMLMKKIFLRYIAKIVFLGDLTKQQRASQQYVFEVNLGADEEAIDEEKKKKKISKSTPAEPINQMELMLSLKNTISALGDAVNNLATSGPAKTKNKKDEVKTDYQNLARVLDRLCMAAYVFTLIVSIPIIRFAADNTEE